MRPSLIFRQYVWLVDTLRRNGRMTLEEISRRWQDDDVADGAPLARTTFNRHRDAILYMFGIIIDCDKSAGYAYYIANPAALQGSSVKSWMLSTLTVGGVLEDSLAVKDRIILEDVPAGEEFLSLIIKAIKTGRRLRATYRRFGAQPTEALLSPYALKLFQRRWYLLAATDNFTATYSLDRFVSAEITDEHFSMPKGFSPQDYYREYFGVLTLADVEVEHVVVRAYGYMPDYLRTLPLHSSQREIAVAPGSNYADFAFDLRPTPDFLQQLLKGGANVEVLEPKDLRKKIKREVKKMRELYK